MSAVTALTGVSQRPLDVEAHRVAALHPQAGGIALFCGVVRDHDHDRDVCELEYVGHPSAADVLADIAAQFSALPDVLGLAVSHRVGRLDIGDVALVAVVSTAHRRAAFTVCADLVDEVKSRLPIWKRQVFRDGTDEWVNCP